jgi:hypothetical protein
MNQAGAKVGGDAHQKGGGTSPPYDASVKILELEAIL